MVGMAGRAESLYNDNTVKAPARENPHWQLCKCDNYTFKFQIKGRV